MKPHSISMIAIPFSRRLKAKTHDNIFLGKLLSILEFGRSLGKHGISI